MTTITPLTNTLTEKLQDAIDSKTKPIGALGQLEKIALQIGRIQNTVTPVLAKPTIMVFAGDHGIVTTGKVSPYPQEVTQQMVLNFLHGGAAINVFCKQHNLNLKVIDAGVNADFDTTTQLIDCKIAKGTNDYSKGMAMTLEQCQTAIQKGRDLAKKAYSEGTNTIGFGEMGIGNTSAAALLMSYFTQTPIENCVGKGTGLHEEGLQTKINTLSQVYDLHKNSINTPLEALASFGGFEIAMMCGAMLEAASLKMTLLIDGFIVTAALLVAHAMQPAIVAYCIYCHTSNEQGHKNMLNFLKAEPLLNLGLRLGEGTGCALAYPILQASVNFLNEMATFKSANVTEA